MYFVFPRTIKWNINSQNTMISTNLWKSDLASCPVLHNQTLPNYHSSFSNTLLKPLMHPFTNNVFFFWIFKLNGLSLPCRGTGNFDATIFFCSRHNNVSSIQAESLLFNLKVIAKEDYSKYFNNLRNVSSLLNILNCRGNYK